MKFSIKDFFSKCDQIRSFLQIFSHLLKKSLMENFIFCVVHFLRKVLVSLIQIHLNAQIKAHLSASDHFSLFTYVF